MTLKDLDEAIDFQLNNKKLIYTQTFKSLKKEWNKNKKFSIVDLFQINLSEDEDLEEIILTVMPDEWVEALMLGLEYFEEYEDYSMCSEINKLLTEIKNN